MTIALHHPARDHEPAADPAGPAAQGPRRRAVRHVRRRRLQRPRRLVGRRAQPRPASRSASASSGSPASSPWACCWPTEGLSRATRRTHVAGGGNAIRGSRVGAGPMGEAERGEAAPRQAVTYFCSHEHRSVVTFAVEAQVPDSWDCPKCGLPASLDSREPAAGAEDRALQDAPGLREGAPLRRRGGGHPRRGAPAPPDPPQGRRDHQPLPRPESGDVRSPDDSRAASPGRGTS